MRKKIVAANWKIVWENNRECYHCNVNHPQYIKANFDHYNADDTSDRVQERIARAVEPYRYDAVFGAWWNQIIYSDGKAAFARSVDRYIRAITG